MELIAGDLILTLEDIRNLHAGAVLAIPPGATVLASQVWFDTVNALEEAGKWEEAEQARDAFFALPRERVEIPGQDPWGDRHDPA